LGEAISRKPIEWVKDEGCVLESEERARAERGNG